MFTQGEDVEADALKKRGWSTSAIARHLGRDRGTVRAHLNGEREPGVRVSSTPDPLLPFETYLKARFVDDPHVWATALFDEVVPLGSDRSDRVRSLLCQAAASDRSAGEVDAMASRSAVMAR
jgi:transposase